jgi:hypothetical protein
MSDPVIGATFCCVVPFLYGAGAFALGLWWERNGGLPWRIVRRKRDDDLFE